MPRIVNILKEIIITFRPSQITKNGIVLFPMFFAVNFWWESTDLVGKLSVVGYGIAAALVFAVVAGALYAFNDIADVREDQAHPKRKERPLASGRLSIPMGWTAAIIGLAGGLAGGFAISLEFGVTVVCYAVLVITYTHVLKRIVLIDVMAIAGGFVLRAVGGVASLDAAIPQNVPVSPWLYTITALGALFLALNKRKAELQTIEGKENPHGHREVLNKYSLPLVNQLITVVAASTLVSYTLYSFALSTAISSVTIPIVSSSPLIVTVPLVGYGLFRYLYITDKTGAGERPERVLLEDRPLQICIVAWLVLSAIMLSLFSA